MLNYSDSPDPGPAQGVFTYTYAIENNSTSVTATGVRLVATLPVLGGQVVEFLGFSQTVGTGAVCDAPGAPQTPAPAIITCDVGSISPRAFANFQLQVRLPAPGVYSSSASITSDNDNPGTDNNNRTQQTTVNNSANLQVNARATSGGADITTVSAGQPFNYVVSTTNLGPHPTEANGALRVRFTVPAGAVVTEAPSGGDWACLPASGFPLPAGTDMECRWDNAPALAVGNTSTELTVPMVSMIGGDSNIDATFSVDAFRLGGTQPMLDPDMSNNTTTVPLTSADGTDLGITKTRSPTDDTVELGSTVTFTLTPRYVAGLAPTGTITVTDTVDPRFGSVTITSAPGWDCSATTGNTVSCSRSDGGSLTAPDDLPAIEISAVSNAAGSIPNVGEIAVTGGHPDVNGENDTDGITLSISNEADLRTLKTASISPVMVNQPFEYTIRVRNWGPLAVPAGQTITVRDTPPAGMTLFPSGTGASVVTNGWTCSRSDSGNFPLVGNGAVELVCTRTDGLVVATGSTAGRVLTVPAVLTQAGTLTNNACVALSGGSIQNPTAPNDCGSVGLLATPGGAGQGADLQVVSKLANPTVVRSGELLTYTIRVRNNGPQPASDVVVTDTLGSLLPGSSPTGFQSASSSQGSCTPSAPTAGTSQTVTCDLGTLTSGQEETVTISVRPTRATSGTRTNTASIHSASIGDPDHDNNTNSVTSTVEAVAIIDISKVNTPDPVRAGEPVTYTITVGSTGPSSAEGVMMTDTLPDNAAFIDMLGTGGAICTPPAAGTVGGTISCDIGTLATGAQRAISYRLRPLSLPRGQSYAGYELVNTVEANTTTQTTGGVTHPTVTAGTITEVEAPLLDVLINKTDTPDPVPLGGTVTYTIRVENDGPSYATNAVMTDVFPAPGSSPTALFSYQGALTVSGGGVCDEPAIGVTAGTLVCRWPGLERGVPQTVTYQMVAEAITLAGSDSGTGTNQARIDVDEEETTFDNNQVTEDTTTRRNEVETDLALTKEADRPTAQPGTQIIYTLTVLNNGPLDLPANSGAQVIDSLPAGLAFVSAPGCVERDGQVVCRVDALLVGDSQVFTITAQVPSDYSGAPEVTNTALVDLLGDTDPTNNDDDATTRVPVGPVSIPVNHPAALLLALLGITGLAGWQRRRRGSGKR